MVPPGEAFCPRFLGMGQRAGQGKNFINRIRVGFALDARARAWRAPATSTIRSGSNYRFVAAWVTASYCLERWQSRGAR